MIKTGAFDCFNRPRSQLMAVYGIMVDRAIERKKKSMNGQMDLFGDIIEDTKLIEDNEYPNINEYVNTVKLQYEREISGTYLSGHPLDGFMDTIKTFTFDSSMIPSETIDDENEMSTGNESIEDFTPEEELYGGLKNGDGVTCGGVITEIKTIQTKSGSKMAFLTIEDLTGSFDAILFNKLMINLKKRFKKTVLLQLKAGFLLETANALQSLLIILNHFLTQPVNKIPNQNWKKLKLKLLGLKNYV